MSRYHCSTADLNELTVIEGPLKGAIHMSALTAENFREVAKQAITAYEKKNLAFDAILWGAIIGYYEAMIADALDRVQALQVIQLSDRQAGATVRKVDP